MKMSYKYIPKVKLNTTSLEVQHLLELFGPNESKNNDRLAELIRQSNEITSELDMRYSDAMKRLKKLNEFLDNDDEEASDEWRFREKIVEFYRMSEEITDIKYRQGFKDGVNLLMGLMN